MDYVMRYVETRIRKNGRKVYYFCPPRAWRLRGIKGERLPDSEAQRVRRHTVLMERGRSKARANTVAYAVKEYEESSKFQSLAAKTRKAYRVQLGKVIKLWGDLHPSEVTEAAVSIILEKCAPQTANQLRAVISNVLGIKAPVRTTKGRDHIWTEAECERFLEFAEPHFAVLFNLMRYTGQRPGDCRAMAWTQYDGTHLQVRQQKTGRLVKILCLPELKALLDSLDKESPLIVTCEGRAVTEPTYDAAMLRIRKLASLTHLQLRDLRRTAVVNLALAGCDDIEIAHITGHGLKSVKSLLDKHYLPRQQEIADRAMGKLIAYRRTKHGMAAD